MIFVSLVSLFVYLFAAYAYGSAMPSPISDQPVRTEVLRMPGLRRILSEDLAVEAVVLADGNSI